MSSVSVALDGHLQWPACHCIGGDFKHACACPNAVKVLLQHIALAHRDWLPLGVLPPAHQQSSQLLLRTIIGAALNMSRHLACMRDSWEC